METLLQQILNLLIQPPGNLIYHLVLAFSVISSLQAAWIGRQSRGNAHTGRLVFGLGMLLLGQAALFLSSGLAWQGILDTHLFLPILDRAIVIFSLVWIVWLWNFPAPARLGDLVTGFLNLGVIILFIFTFSSWKVQGANLPFNNTWMDWAWEIAGLFVVVTGMAILLFSRPTGWGFGVGMLGLSLAGFIAHLTLPTSGGDFSGYIRLSQLAAFPLLTMLLHRFTVPATRTVQERYQAAETQDEGMFPRSRERRRYSTDPRTLHALLDISMMTESEKVIMGMPKAIAHSMLADLCFLVNGPNYGHIVLQSGYDLIREEEIKGTMLEQSQLPMLSNALQRAKPLRVLTTDSQPQDLKALSSALNLKETGSLMFVPLTLNEKPQGGILFLSPYSNRQWSLDDQGFLSSEVELIAQILFHAQQQEQTTMSGAQAGDTLRAEVDSLQAENQRLLNELNGLNKPAKTSHKMAQDVDLSALVALQEEAQDQIATLQAENERLQSALKDQGISVLSPDEFNRMETELRTTLQEIAQLQNRLAQANAHNLMLEREYQQTNNGSNEEQAVLMSIVQEIRQPMSSIVGYTDLLLGETVGILGALQRQFLERIKASSERTRALLQDLIQVTALHEAQIELLPESIDLGPVIDNAVDETSGQLREKNIALHVDLPQDMPKINADRDVIQQIILQLLQNAGNAAPQEGAVTLRARTQQEEGNDYLLLQVTDTGGGIQPDDMPRVFSRRYRADLPLIQGLGDTGVGLSIAKTLVEAHGGRIWVESTAGESTTFSVLLPIHPETNTEPRK